MGFYQFCASVFSTMQFVIVSWNQVSYRQGGIQTHCVVENDLDYLPSSCPTSWALGAQVCTISSFYRFPGLSTCYVSPPSVELHSTITRICSSISFDIENDVFWNYLWELKKKKNPKFLSLPASRPRSLLLATGPSSGCSHLFQGLVTDTALFHSS